MSEIIEQEKFIDIMPMKEDEDLCLYQGGYYLNIDKQGAKQLIEVLRGWIDEH